MTDAHLIAMAAAMAALTADGIAPSTRLALATAWLKVALANGTKRTDTTKPECLCDICQERARERL